MILFIEILCLTMLWIQGFNCLFSEGHLLEKVGDWINNNLPEYVYKPTVGCPMCMSSLHGTIAYIRCISPNIDSWKETLILWPVFCICLCGINYILSKIVNPHVKIEQDV